MNMIIGRMIAVNIKPVICKKFFKRSGRNSGCLAIPSKSLAPIKPIAIENPNVTTPYNRNIPNRTSSVIFSPFS